MIAALIAAGCLMHDWRNGIFLWACLSFTFGIGVSVIIVGALGWVLTLRRFYGREDQEQTTSCDVWQGYRR